jgi:hypothetical protein
MTETEIFEYLKKNLSIKTELKREAGRLEFMVELKLKGEVITYDYDYIRE